MTELDLVKSSEDEVSNITIDDEFKIEKRYINPCKFDDAKVAF